MSLKTKLVSTISAICMVLALLTVGVWAVSTASVTLGGSVSFTADNIHARVTGSVTGTQETISLAELNYSADLAPTTELDSWANNQMTFTSENLITMRITVENLSEERSLFVTLTDNTTTDNVNKTLKQGASNYTSGSAVEVTAGNTTTFTITLSVTDKNQSASATVSYQVDLRDANAEVEEAIELLHDTTNDYYYVEMGNYQGAPVRWRVVGVEGEHYTYNESQAPTGELTFILETVTTSHAFGDSYWDEDASQSYGNGDYATSAIRQYITGHDCALNYNQTQDYPVSDNYLNDLGISEDDEIYSKIKARDIQDLYRNIDLNYSDNLPHDSSTTETGEDKLWIPSVAEIRSLVCGEDISSNGLSLDQNENLKFYDSENSARYYWLRSSAVGDDIWVYYVVGEGNISSEYPGGPMCVRPAFILEI